MMSADALVDVAAAPSRAMPRWTVRAGLSLFSGGLFALSFPPADLGFVFGWLSLVPLAFAVRGVRVRDAAMLGGLFGFVATQIVFGWMYRFEAFHLTHGALLGAYVASYHALFAVALSRWAFQNGGLLYVPAAGALIEWTRAHAGFLAFPWATFGQTQHENLFVLQLAAYGGEILVGALVVAVNVALAQALAREGRIRRPAIIATLVIAALAHVGGAWRLSRARDGREIVAAAVQPAIEPGSRERNGEAILARLGDLSRAAKNDGAELVVWPESSVGAFEADLDTKLAVRDIVDETGVPVVLGSSHVEKLTDGKPKPGTKPTNAAFVMAPHVKVAAPYEKVRLLPFGEYRPIDLPEWIAPKVFDTTPGARHLTLAAGDITVEPVICWENLFADDVRATATDEPTVIAHLVNDGWFGPTAQPRLHNLVSVMRAVESDRPVVIASNMGPSQIIDAKGRVLARADRFFAPSYVTAKVTMPSGQTPFRRYGDWTWALPFAVVLAALRRRR